MRRLDFRRRVLNDPRTTWQSYAHRPESRQVTMLPTADPLAYMLADWEPSPPSPYLADPIAWAHDKLGASLWSKQRAIAESVVVNRRTAVKSCHGAGKSWTAGMLAAWWIDIHPPGEAIVISTAPTYKQVHAVLWEEIRAAHRKGKLPGQVLQTDEWKIGDILVGMGRKPADHDPHGFQGIHRRFVLAILDEACHDDQTDVLTERGWMRFADLDGTERLLTMDPANHQARYTVPQKIVRKRHQGPMHEYAAKGLNFCVTPDHDMYFHGRSHNRDTAWRKQPMEYLATAANKYIKKSISRELPDVESFTIPAFDSGRKRYPARSVRMDDWMEFLGWYLSEGSLHFGGRDYPGSTTITQHDPAVLARLAALAGRMGFRPKIYGIHLRIHDRQLAEHLLTFGRGCLVKRMPRYVFDVSPRQKRILLDAYSEGDGYHKGSGEIIYTSSPDMADDLQELILMTGVPSVVRRRALQGQTNQIEGHAATSTVDGWVVTRPAADTEAKFYPKNDRVIDYDGMVYCAQVPPDALLFTRRNGYTMWSGNCGIPDALWTAVEAITTNADCRILAIGNPDDPATEFGRVCSPGAGWSVLQISSFDTPNLSGEDVPDKLRPLLPDPGWVEDARKRWGEDSPVYASKVLGEFPEISQDTLIPQRWIVDAQNRELPRLGHPRLGVDVARFGSDQTVITAAWGGHVRVVESRGKQATTETTGRVIAQARETQAVEIRVDGVGVGGGVVDQLAEQGYPALDMQAGSGSTDPQMFKNARAQWYWSLRKHFEDGLIDLDPDDDETAAQLGAIRYSYSSRGQIVIESKDDMRKRGMPSPDRADAVMLVLADVNLPTGHVLDADDLLGEDEMRLDWATDFDY